jgi:hypothetical protein
MQFDYNGLKGLKTADPISAKLYTGSGIRLRDCISGEQIALEKDGSFHLLIEPGGGRVMEKLNTPHLYYIPKKKNAE